jgi:hypothetical protein
LYKIRREAVSRIYKTNPIHPRCSVACYILRRPADFDTKLLLGIRISERRGTDPAATFLG